MNFIRYVYRSFKNVLLEVKFLFLCLKCKKSRILDDTENSTLIVTHNYGGGTAIFEKNYASSSEEDIIFCRMISCKKNIVVKIERKNNIAWIPANRIDEIFAKDFKCIIVNSLASFFNIAEFISVLVSYKECHPKTRFVCMVHDYHCVCPTINLVADNWNCNLECDSHKCRFDSFIDKFTGTISRWRGNWQKLFSSADEIRCFSESSKIILKNAYPNLPDEKFNIVPHSMSFCKFRPIKNAEKLSTHIGIVGAVYSVPKGRFVVNELLERIPEDIPISIIGTTRRQLGASRRKNTKFFGKYEHDDLQRLVENETISMEVFPSICSETFSYLVSEHIAMNIPVMCFDMGAQAEKVRAYEKGIVVKNVDEMISTIKNIALKKES